LPRFTQQDESLQSNRFCNTKTSVDLCNRLPWSSVLAGSDTTPTVSEGINQADTRFQASVTVQMVQLHVRMTTTLVCVLCPCMVWKSPWSFVKYTLKPKDIMEDILHNTKDRVFSVAPLCKIALAQV
jgi:hypothetical protein